MIVGGWRVGVFWVMVGEWRVGMLLGDSGCMGGGGVCWVIVGEWRVGYDVG